MIYKLFSIFDSKAEAFMQPFFSTTKGQAIRMFADAVNDSNSNLNKHAADFTLFYVGEFDDGNAVLTKVQSLESIGNAIEFLKQKEI